MGRQGPGKSLPWVTNRAAARWAKEGSTVVSTVKGIGVGISLVSGRRFAAEEWVMPEDGPSKFRIALPRASVIVYHGSRAAGVRLVRQDRH
jgi:hypothetical protein